VYLTEPYILSGVANDHCICLNRISY